MKWVWYATTLVLLLFSSSAAAQVTDPPAAYFETADFVYGAVPLTVHFMDGSTGIIDTWNWSFGDGSYSSDQNPTHDYGVPGVFNVNLTVCNAAGCNSLELSNLVDTTDLPLPAGGCTSFSTGTASASSEYGEYTATMIFNDNYDDMWVAGASLPQWVMLDYGDGVTHRITNFSIMSVDGYRMYGPRVFTLEGSNDSATWDVLESHPASVDYYNIPRWRNFSVSYPGEYRYYLLNTQLAHDADLDNLFITEMDFYTCEFTSPQVLPVPPPADSSDSSTRGYLGSAAAGGIRAGEKVTLLLPGSVVQKLVVSVKTSVDTLTVVAENRKTLPPFISSPEAVVYQYFTLASPLVADESIAQIVMEFSVPQGWLRDLWITGQDLVVLRYDGNSWNKLQTEEIGDVPEGVLFRVISPGFSWYAIGVEIPAQATPTTAPSPNPPAPEPVTLLPTPPPAQLITSRVPDAAPPVTTIPLPPLSPSPQPGGGIPLMFILGCLIGIAAAGGGGLLIRRWWVRRQNPALFREYK